MSSKAASRELTKHLKEMGSQLSDQMGEDGRALTKTEALADLIWKYALGYTEEIEDEIGRVVRVQHKPIAWAMQFVFERTEGKAAAAPEETSGKPTVAETVRGLAKDRLNAMAEKAAAGAIPPPPDL